MSQIKYEYQVSHDAMYRHAHALGLFEKRKKNIMRALERIIEKVMTTQPSASAVVAAINAYIKLNGLGPGADEAQGTNPTS